MPFELDAIDLSIIKELMVDGRMSATHISRKIADVPARTIQYRIENLQAKRVIRIFPIINLPAIGVELRADMLIDVEPKRIDALAKHLKSFNRVCYIASIFGEYDLSMTMYARNTSDFYSFINESVLSFPGVKDTKIHFVPNLIKSSHSWGIDEPNYEINGNVTNPATEQNIPTPFELDSIDERMINLLADNGRISISAIARQLGDVSKQVLRKRLKKLIKTGVVYFVVYVNPASIGFPIRADIFLEVNPKTMAMDVASTLAGYQETSYVACSMGGPDVSIQIYVREYLEVYDFAKHLVHSLDYVTDIQTILTAELIKDLYDTRLPYIEASNS